MEDSWFTPWASLFGGVLIGVASTLLMRLMGRVMGATGELAGVVQPSSGADFTWRAVLLAGMMTGPAIVWLISGNLPAAQVPVFTVALV